MKYKTVVTVETPFEFEFNSTFNLMDLANDVVNHGRVISVKTEPINSRSRREEFVRLCDEAIEVRDDSKMEWDTKYNLIFCPQFQGAVEDTGIEFEWVDYDESYESDLRQFVSGMERKAEQFR